MSLLSCIAAVGLLTVAVPNPTASPGISAGDLLLRQSGNVFSAGVRGQRHFLRSARLTAWDGKAKKALALQGAKVVHEGNATRVNYQAADGLEFALRLQPEGRCVVWEVNCVNAGAEARWLELGPELEAEASNIGSFFDGWDDFEKPAEAIRSKRIEGDFPAAIAWNDHAAIGVGLAADEIVSYFRNEYLPGKDVSVVACRARIVVDPGARCQVRFVTCAAVGSWGKYEILDAYYESFPKWFRPQRGIDPRANGAGAQYRAFPVGPWSPEICRRLGCGWEWCYAPFRRTGDIVGRPELWDYTPARPMDKLRAGPRDKYLAWRRQAFADGQQKCNIGMMFYIPSQVWCEESLARSRYADSLQTDPKATLFFDKPWVTGHDNELRVFPLGTSFGEQTDRDLRQIAAELDISGFAFDTAGGTARYTGPALKRLPRRAWDEQVGEYCSELVAIAHVMDQVHRLERNGRRLAVVANPMSNGSYASCFHCDSAMLEATPWTSIRTQPDRLRWKMGRKTLVWWEEYDVHEFVDTETITADQLRAVYRGLADYTLLASLRLGFVPPPAYTQGVSRLVRWMPAMLECAQAGWQPVPAVKVADPAWVSRFGGGLGTLLAVAHETGQTIAARLRVEQERLGKGRLLFAHYDGSLLAQDEEITLEIPPRTPRLLRAEIEVLPGHAVTGAEVRRERGIAAERLFATLQGDGGATLRFRVPVGMTIKEVQVDGRPAAFDVADAVASCKIMLHKGIALEVRYVSTLFQLEDRDLLEFPFVLDGKPACVIAVPTKAAEAAAPATFRIQEYFRYWYGRVLPPPERVVLPVIKADEPMARAVVLSLVPGSPARVTVARNQLRITAADPAQLNEAVLGVLGALDRRYWSPDLLVPSAINRKFGLAGTVLEWPSGK